jgi:NusA-like KH domain protein
MAGVIDMRLMRYINLFSRVSKVSTTNCFIYNNQIIFAVPRDKVSQAIGKDASNVRKLRDILGKKIKIVVMPDRENKEEIVKFIGDVVEPIEFNKIEVKEDSVVINAGRQSKAALIGRNRTREKELSDILKNNFHILNLKIA